MGAFFRCAGNSILSTKYIDNILYEYNLVFVTISILIILIINFYFFK